LFRLLSEPFQKGTKNSLSLRTWTGRWGGLFQRLFSLSIGFLVSALTATYSIFSRG
jgi:hypothetical protein